MKNCTAIIVNFLREPYLFKCVESLRATYPDIKIIVGENGEYTNEKRKKLAKFGAEYIEVEFDAGVCKARNVLVDHVKTDYVLVGDDDFFYNENTNVDGMLRLLENNQNIDLVGGRVFEKGTLRNYQGFITRVGKSYIYKALDIEGGFSDDIIRFKQCDLTFNFFVAKTEVVRATRWDENIKVAYEHSDFFLSLKEGGRTVVFTPDAVVIHKPEIKDLICQEYIDYRGRKSDKKYYFKKHNLDFAIDMSGRKDTIDKEGIKDVDFIIKTFERPECLEKLLFSIAKYYPTANIFIADDSKVFSKKYYLNLWARLFAVGLKNKPSAFNLGYDVGLSRARNFLVENTLGKYKLLLDDDFIFNESSDITKFVEILENNSDIGVVGGAIMQEGNLRHYEGNFEQSGGVLRYIPIKEMLPLNYCDIVFNFALFRKEVFQDIKWDDDIKISGEHTDFYLRLKELNKWKVAYLPEVVVDHEQIFNQEYKKMRSRTEFFPKLFEKHNIHTIINFNGVVYTKDGAGITKTRI